MKKHAAMLLDKVIDVPIKRSPKTLAAKSAPGHFVSTELDRVFHR